MRSKKIRVEVSGGLANQVFMYLGGIYLAERNGRSLELVSTPNDIHSESLHTVSISHEIKRASKFESIAIKLLRRISKATKITKVSLERLGLFFTTEVGYPADIPVRNSTKFASAYFQSYLIFRMALKGNSVFSLLGHTPSKWAMEIKENLIAPNDVVIHVRLGDYLAERDQIGLVGIDYYEVGIRKARELGGNGKIRVITNDVTDCKNILASITYDLEYIEQPTNVRDLDSLFLLAQHSYIVISNSSFSLLAGLEANSSTVIRPTPWFKNLKEPNELSPPDWIQIPSAWR
jgi:hypothetical protein